MQEAKAASKPPPLEPAEAGKNSAPINANVNANLNHNLNENLSNPQNADLNANLNANAAPPPPFDEGSKMEMDLSLRGGGMSADSTGNLYALVPFVDATGVVSQPMDVTPSSAPTKPKLSAEELEGVVHFELCLKIAL